MSISKCQMNAFMIACLVVALLGCTSESELYWDTDEDGRFYTHDLARAQEELPFSFAHPSYLPSDLAGPPNIIGSLVKKSIDGKLFVEVTYERMGDAMLESFIRLTARNHTYVPMNPETNSEYKVMEINGISITQLGISIDISNDDEPYFLDGFSFWWDKEGVFYEVRVYGYNNDEAIMVVESMID